MKVNMKIISIAICCFISALWAKTQCCEDLTNLENRWVTITSKYCGKVLDNYGSDNHYVGQHTPHFSHHPDYGRQLWMIKKIDSNFFTITSKHSEKALDCFGNGDHHIGQHTPHLPTHQDYDRQLWSIN
jgi:hypothetical protein